MNRTRLVTVICWAISAVALSGLVLWFLLSGIFSFGFGFGVDFIGLGSYEPVATHSVSADDIDSLSIDWTSGRVTIGTHEGSEIQITELARRDLRAGEELRQSISGGTLTIEFMEQRRLTGINNFTKQLEVLIPHTLSENLERFHATTVSGRIVVSGIHAADFTANTTSGRIELFSVQAEDIYLRTVSGRIDTTNTEAQSLRTHTTSGRHELSGSFGEVNARSTSGRIAVISTVVPESLTARTTSGRISVTVPRAEAISVQYSTTSGRFTSEIPILTHGGADAQFNLSTTSGRIEILGR